jgi:2-dehydropantoate 2-reductase
MRAPGSSLTSSMYRDLRKGAPVEVDHILGDFIERGGGRGVATPLLQAAFVNLRVYQGAFQGRQDARATRSFSQRRT